jgi:hypothetical protein
MTEGERRGEALASPCGSLDPQLHHQVGKRKSSEVTNPMNEYERLTFFGGLFTISQSS